MKYPKTGVMVADANICPSRCGNCGGQWCFVSHVDDQQFRGYTSWSWQCQNCGQINTLTRQTVIRRYRAWRDNCSCVEPDVYDGYAQCAARPG